MDSSTSPEAKDNAAATGSSENNGEEQQQPARRSDENIEDEGEEEMEFNEAYHELVDIGAGFFKLRTLQQIQDDVLDDPKLEDPMADLLASEYALKYQYCNKRERSYLEATIFCNHVCSVNECGPDSCALHLADGTFLFVKQSTETILNAMLDAEKKRLLL